MALDTRDRRASAIGVKLSFVRVFPNPDGALTSANDRGQIIGEYRIQADGVVTGTLIYHYHTHGGSGTGSGA